jgi:hypothetical protein
MLAPVTAWQPSWDGLMHTRRIWFVVTSRNINVCKSLENTFFSCLSLDDQEIDKVDLLCVFWRPDGQQSALVWPAFV